MKNTRSSALLLTSLLALSVSVLYAADAPKATTPLAKVGNTILTEEEMHKEMGMNLYEAENQLYQVKKGWIDQKAKGLIFAQAAKEAGLSLTAWQTRELDAKTVPPTDQEIDQLAPRFAMQGSTTPPTSEQYSRMKQQAKQYLTQQKRSQREAELYQQLSAKTPVEVFFVKPEAPIIDVTYPKDSPIKGPANAPVTIVEYTDFQCPWCKKSQESVKAVEAAYGPQVKFVDRMFPLTSIHPRAMPSAEAAFCAKDQGKYWEMREKLFVSQTMSDQDFSTFAKDLGLNEKKFAKCLTDHKYQSAIEADIADGSRIGVRGTPTFFVNGVQAGFPQLQEAVKTALDKKKA